MESDLHTYNEYDSADIDVNSSPGLVVYQEANMARMLEFYWLDKLSISLNSNVNTMTDQCGTTEAHKKGSTNWTMTVQGRVPKSQLETLKKLGDNSKVWYADSHLHDMDFVVQDMTVDQLSDENTVGWTDSNGVEHEEMAFGFQMQLKNPKSD